MSMRPPAVKTVKLRAINGKGQRLVVKFTKDVGASLTVADLVVTGPDGHAVDPSKMVLRYNAKTHTARWTFPGLTGRRLPAGQYTVDLKAAAITDGAGRPLDGNDDGTAGDDFVLTRRKHGKAA